MEVLLSCCNSIYTLIGLFTQFLDSLSILDANEDNWSTTSPLSPLLRSPIIRWLVGTWHFSFLIYAAGSAVFTLKLIKRKNVCLSDRAWPKRDTWQDYIDADQDTARYHLTQTSQGRPSQAPCPREPPRRAGELCPKSHHHCVRATRRRADASTSIWRNHFFLIDPLGSVLESASYDLPPLSHELALSAMIHIKL